RFSGRVAVDRICKTVKIHVLRRRPRSCGGLMSRVLLCLVVCLVFAVLYRQGQEPAAEEQKTPEQVLEKSTALPHADTQVFLKKCLQRYDREVQGYTATLEKRERVAGTLHPREIIEAAFREQPFSVFMKWKTGASGAKAVAYVEGQNDGKMLVNPTGV